MSLTLTTAPTVEPVSLDELKDWIGYTSDDDNGTLRELLVAAREHLESIMWRQFITAAWTWKVDRFLHRLYPPRPNLLTVTSIVYVDSNGTSQTLAATEYQVVAGESGYICEAYNKTWPTTREQPDAVTVVYTSGYGASPVLVPTPIKRAILATAAHWYMDRGCMGGTLPAMAQAVVHAHRALDTRRLVGV